MIGIEFLNSLSVAWAEFMWYCLVDSTAIFLLVGSLWLLLRKRVWVSIQLGYILFLLVLLKLIIPGQLSIPGLISYLFSQEVIFQEGTVPFGFFPFSLERERDGKTSVSPPVQNNPIDNREKQPTLTLNLCSQLMLIWLFVVVLFLVRFTWVEWCIYRKFQKTKLLNVETIPVDLNHLQKIAGVRQSVRWVTGTWIQSPMTYGLIRPIIAVPEDMFEHYSPNQIRWILLHELAHVKRWDAIVSYLQKILQILFFFHPVVWWVNTQIDQLREYACDDSALAASQVSRRDCGEGFLSLVVQTNGLPTVLPATLGMINYKTMIRRRLMRILDRKRSLQVKLTISTVLLIFIIGLIVVPFSLKVAMAQSSRWELVSDTGPYPIAYHKMVFDSKRGVILLHGGTRGPANNNESLNETWEWDGTNWTLVSTEGPAICNHGMAYDSDRGVAVIFGGDNPYGSLADPYTWEWDSNTRTWKRFDTAYVENREDAYMVYDREHKWVIRHGGVIKGSISSETWAWNGKEWTLLTSDGPARAGHRIVYDTRRKRTILFGGWSGVFGEFPIESTWEFDGSSWKNIPTPVEPPVRLYFMFAFDSIRNVAVLFGGGTFGNASFFRGFPTVVQSDTWEWDGEKWTEIDTSGPAGRWLAAMAYDPLRKKMVLLGGTPDFATGFKGTWEYSAPVSGMSMKVWMNY